MSYRDKINHEVANPTSHKLRQEKVAKNLKITSSNKLDFMCMDVFFRIGTIDSKKAPTLPEK